MDIAAMSIDMATVKMAQSLSIAVTKKAMDAAEVEMQGLLNMMEGASPSFGSRLDVRA